MCKSDLFFQTIFTLSFLNLRYCKQDWLLWDYCCCHVAISAQFSVATVRLTTLPPTWWMLPDFPSMRCLRVWGMLQPFWWRVNLYRTSPRGNSLGKPQPTCQLIKLYSLCSRHLRLGRRSHPTWWPWHVLMTDWHLIHLHWWNITSNMSAFPTHDRRVWWCFDLWPYESQLKFLNQMTL